MGFDNIIGHEKQKSLLLSFLEKERLPHAFIFAGQDGIGKKRTAIEFTKYIFCAKSAGCGKCIPCLKVERGVHPDLLFVEGENSIGIEQSRMISKEIHEYPYESNKRVIIIDRADTMTHEATNALLKTLEEPPPFNVFFLITSSERSIPLTVRSRCTRMAFSPLTKDNLKQYFLELHKMDEEKAQLFSQISCGSIGYGLFWMEENNLLLRRTLVELVTGKNRSFLDTTIISEKVSKNSKDVSIYLSFLLSFFRDMFLVSNHKDTAMIINRDVRELLEGEVVDLKWIDTSIRRIQEAIHAMRYNVNKWLVFENLLLQIMR
ncbi:MAG: DNA polymerase III subunit [Proteobacteria bacterium]|nr:DNA polymerase III subunit [Pseudomonadota bacterium]